MGSSQSKTEKLRHYLDTQLLPSPSIHPSPPDLDLESFPIKTESRRPQIETRFIPPESLIEPAESSPQIQISFNASQPPSRTSLSKSVTSVEMTRSKKSEKILNAIDGRHQVWKTHEWPYSVHGVVCAKFGGGKSSRGSGTLIGLNIVLTAGHILYNHEKIGKRNPVSIQFFPAVNGQSFPFRTVDVESHFVSPGYIENKREDYALIFLKEPIGEKTGYFGLACLDEEELLGKQVNITGYPEDKGTINPKTYQMWGMGGKICDVKEEKAEISYLIDTEEGQSGSGIWYQEGENFYVCGIHTRGGFDLNFGTWLTKKICQQIHAQIQKMKMLKEHLLKIEDKQKTLKFNELVIDAKCIELLMKYKLDHLKALDLEGKEIGQKGAEELAKNTSWRSLEELDLFQNNIGAKGAENLAKNSSWVSLKMLHLDQNNIGCKGAKSLAENISWVNLSYLNLNGNNLGDQGVVELVKNQSWTNLSKLFLAQNNIGLLGAQELAKNSSWKNITVLCLNDNNLGAEGANALAGNTSWRNLKELFLKKNRLGIEGARNLSQNVSWKKLEELYIGANKINAKGVQALTQNISWGNLTMLDLSSNKISTAATAAGKVSQDASWINLSLSETGAESSGSLLGNPYWGSLSKLNLSWNKISAEGVKELFSMKLVVLNLRNNKIGAEGAELLARTNSSWNILEELDLYNNNIGAKGAKALAENSSWCNLKKLGLARNNIRSEGAKGLAENESWANLTELNLSGNEIGATGAEGLAKNASWENLEVLHLSWNNIGMRGAKKLAENVSWVNLMKIHLCKTKMGSKGRKVVAGNEHWTRLMEENLRA